MDNPNKNPNPGDQQKQGGQQGQNRPGDAGKGWNPNQGGQGGQQGGGQQGGGQQGGGQSSNR